MKGKAIKTIGIGLLGLGTVGSGVIKILRSHAKTIEDKTGIRPVIRKVCVRSLSKRRAVALPRKLLTTNPAELIRDPSVDIVVEVAGGIHPAREIIEKALSAGKHVVTANKALLAEEGNAIFRKAAQTGGRVGIEASVCGGIPIIKCLTEGLVSNDISQFFGIVNGTCNFILTAMSSKAVDFASALEEAQARGYAEKNPRLDIDGTDSAHKLAILARLAFRADVPFKSLFVEGIRSVSASDIEYARELGYVIKLLAIGKKMKSGLELRVHPTLLPLDHPLAAVRGVYNAVFIHADQAGALLLYGKGAGRLPTASAVISDILDIAGDISKKTAWRSPAASMPRKARVLPIDSIRSKYYLRFQVEDRPGVLGRIARTLGAHHISILSVHQKESHDPRSVPVVILTYEAFEKNVRRALKEIDSTRRVGEKTVMIRMEK